MALGGLNIKKGEMLIYGIVGLWGDIDINNSVQKGWLSCM